MNSKKSGTEGPKRPTFPEEEPTTNLGRIKLRRVQVNPDSLSKLMDSELATPEGIIDMLEQGLPKNLAERAKQGGTIMQILHKRGVNGLLDDVLELVRPTANETDFEKATNRYIEHMDLLGTRTDRIKRRTEATRRKTQVILTVSGRSISQEVEEEIGEKEILVGIKTLWANAAASKYMKKHEKGLRESLVTNPDNLPELSTQNLQLCTRTTTDSAHTLAQVLKLSGLDRIPTAETERGRLEKELEAYTFPRGNIRKALTSSHVPSEVKDANITREVMLEAMATRTGLDAVGALSALDALGGASVMRHETKAFYDLERALLIFKDFELMERIVHNENLDEIGRAEALKKQSERSDLRELKGHYQTRVRSLLMLYPRLSATFDFNQMAVLASLNLFSRGLFQRQYDKSPDTVRKMIRAASVVANQPVVHYPDKED